MKMLKSYVENGIIVKVYPEKKVKRLLWQKNDTFYAAKMRVGDDVGMFSAYSRKPGKA
jgi:hypothetical protein